MNKHHIMVIGAHCGDAEVMSGALVAKYTQEGHQATLVHMTPGEKGHKTMDPEEYAKQKIDETHSAARVLGADCIVLPYKDGELPCDDKVKYELCDIIRQVKPNIIITHWVDTIHKDHTNTSKIVEDARFYAALPAIKRKEPAHGVWRLYYAENWEDPYDYVPDTYVDVTSGYDRWLESLKEYELFAGEVSSFRYVDYYKALATMRGCLSNSKYAVGMMLPKGANVVKGKHIPGFEL